jgi:hypothetical protein
VGDDGGGGERSRGIGNAADLAEMGQAGRVRWQK